MTQRDYGAENNVFNEQSDTAGFNWCGDCMNWTDNELIALQQFMEQHCVYGVVQSEIAPTTGTAHLQFFFILKQKKRKGTILNAPGLARCHLRKRYLNSTNAQAAEYCKKEESREPDTEPWEFGELPPDQQGKRNDWAEFTADLAAGTGDRDLAAKHTRLYAANMQRVDALRQLLGPRGPVEYSQPYVEVHYGDSDSFKSRAVWEAIGDNDCFKQIPGQGKWFDNYFHEDYVWLDDFRAGVSIDLLLQLLDGYGTTAEVKGGSVHINAKHIYITSILPPSEWYKYTKREPYHQVARRITKLVQHVIEPNGRVSKVVHWTENPRSMANWANVREISLEDWEKEQAAAQEAAQREQDDIVANERAEEGARQAAADAFDHLGEDYDEDGDDRPAEDDFDFQ